MEDIFEVVFKGIFIFLGHILIEVVFELMLKGPGYLIVRMYTPKQKVNFDGAAVIIWGVLFWCLAASMIFYLFG